MIHKARIYCLQMQNRGSEVTKSKGGGGLIRLLLNQKDENIRIRFYVMLVAATHLSGQNYCQ
jgi:transcriptional regulator CtsR